MSMTSNQVSDKTMQCLPATANASDRNRAAVRDAFHAWASGQGNVSDLLAEDATWTVPGWTPGAGQWKGRQAYIDAAVTPLFDKLAATARPELTGLWTEGNEVIMRWRQDTPLKAGGSYRNEYAWFLTMRDGKATEVTAFLDLAAYAAAVGRKA